MSHAMNDHRNQKQADNGVALWRFVRRVKSHLRAPFERYCCKTLYMMNTRQHVSDARILIFKICSRIDWMLRNQPVR